MPKQNRNFKSKPRHHRARPSKNKLFGRLQPTDSYFITTNTITPAKRTVQLPWTFTKQVVAGDTGAGSYELILSAANPYDPNFSDGTSTYQPQGFDNYGQFYTYWFVKSCRLDLEVVNTNASTSLLIAVGPSPDQLSTTYSIYRNYRDVRSKTLSSTGIRTFATTMSFPTNYVLDTNPRDNSSLRSSFGAPPAQTWYYCVLLQSMGLSTFTADVVVTLTYTMELSHPKKMAYS